MFLSFLNKIVSEFDPDAYFEPVTSGIIETFVYKPNKLGESLKRIDRQSLQRMGESLDLEHLVEAVNLSAQDKSKLSSFIRRTNDPEEIENYVAGLAYRKDKNKKLKEELEETEEIEDEYDEYAEDCKFNIDGKLPEDVQTYLDEYTGSWSAYGQLPSGIIYWNAPDDELYYFADMKDFANTIKYNIEAEAEMYFDDPDAYDFSDEYIAVLEKYR